MKTALPVALLVLLAPLAAAAPVPEPECGNKPIPTPVPVLNTSLGVIKVELYRDKAPATVSNFLAYVDARFYDDTVLHRVTPNFMIQGGGHTADLKEKPSKD